MLYIFTNKFDVSSQKIIFWLNRLKKEFKVLYTELKINQINLEISNSRQQLFLETGDVIHDINLENDRFFYRRGSASYYHNLASIKGAAIERFLQNETSTVENFLDFIFLKQSNVKNRKELNKLQILKLASDIGINIPNTAVITSKKSLVDFFVKNNKQIIIKPLYEGLNVRTKQGFLKTYTSQLNIEDIDSLENYFSPTLIQSEVKKYVEIRSFYLKGEFYSMAIFSQKDSMTSIDFRNYNSDRPLKIAPFKLPLNLEGKLEKLFQNLRIDTGSIDLCLTPENKFVFLEINPVGQYGMLSLCNYHLDRKLAEII